MNRLIDAIQALIRMNREALRELAKVENTTSADFAHICRSHDILNEQFHLLLQQKEEIEVEAYESEGAMVDESVSADPPKTKRGRGAVKQFYLKDMHMKPSFLMHVTRIFQSYYAGSRQFVLKDGTLVKAHHFLACLYDLGIKRGITSAEAPVKDFCELVFTACRDCSKAADFTTAYNTVQKVLKQWNPLTGKSEVQFYYTTARFHNIDPAAVPSHYKETYETWHILYSHVEGIYNETEA